MTLVYKLDKFEGPLDLLLQLIESADLDITEISIAAVTDQFMHYLDRVEKHNPEELADFLVVAAKLLLIKSRVLLPSLHMEDDGQVAELENQLKIYKEYFEASKSLEKILAAKQILFARQKLLTDVKTIFNPPTDLTSDKLKRFFLQVIKEIEPLIKLPKQSIIRSVSIKEKIESIKNKIFQGLSLRFSEIVGESENRTEIIVSFLSVLELVKQKTIVVKQDKLFNEIILERYK